MVARGEWGRIPPLAGPGSFAIVPPYADGKEVHMPVSTVIVVGGSWILLLILTLLYYFVWSKHRDWGDE